MVQDSTVVTDYYHYLSDFKTLLTVYSIVLSVIGAVKVTQRIIQLWDTRNLRKVWGINDKDTVIVICSELDKPVERQNVEPREFIYSLKYGDVDAYFEVVVTLLRLYPKLKLKILSSGEAESTKLDMDQTLVLIGGPDYNSITDKVLEKGVTQFDYLSPDDVKSEKFPDEIVIQHTPSGNEYCEPNDSKDYGYFERINNPNNPKKKIILIGGCHTIGVTAAIKAFSLLSNEHEEVKPAVLNNSKIVAKKINNKNSEFAVLVKAERVGQSVNTPIVKEKSVFVRETNHED